MLKLTENHKALISHITETLTSDTKDKMFTSAKLEKVVHSHFIMTPNDELETAIVDAITSAFREEGLINMKCGYTFPQYLLSEIILNPRIENSLVPSLYNTKKYSIELDDDQHKRFMQFVEKQSDVRGSKWVFIKQEMDKKTLKIENIACNFLSNYGKI